MAANGPPGGKAPLGADLLIPALALALAVYFFVSIADLSWEAKANGVLIGAILVSLVAIQLARIGIELAKGRATLGFGRILAPREALAKRVGLVLITVAFIGSVRWLGLTLALFLALAAALYVAGVRRRAALVLVPLAVALAAYLLFIVALDSDLPRGPVERLIPALVEPA
jgi:hypothetical protein